MRNLTTWLPDYFEHGNYVPNQVEEIGMNKQENQLEAINQDTCGV